MENTTVNTISTENNTLVEESTQNIDQSTIHQEIPKNSETFLIDEFTSRFSSAIWYSLIQSIEVVLAGVGGIGSYVGFLLSRLKIRRMVIYDPDIVDSSNMSGQLYRVNDIGDYKVNSLARIMDSFSNFYTYHIIRNYFTRATGIGSKIMICGFDSMSARKEFFESWINYIVNNVDSNEMGQCLFIDGRLAAEEFQVLCIKGDDVYNINRYRQEFLFNDDEADPTICSYKQTSFMANMIASVMINLLVNFIANQCEPLIDRDVPFLTRYNAETMFFKTEM